MDTTVILAQPRVSRLRADAVYVDGRASAEIVEKHSGEFSEGPSFSLRICPTDIPKQAEKVTSR